MSEAWQGEEGLLAGTRVVVLTELEANMQTGLILTQWGALVSFAPGASSVQHNRTLLAQRGGVMDLLLVSAGADVIITSRPNGLSAASMAEVAKELRMIICQIDSATTLGHLIERQALAGASAIAAALLARKRGRLYYVTVGPTESSTSPESMSQVAFRELA